jgi:hypothetical protein
MAHAHLQCHRPIFVAAVLEEVFDDDTANVLEDHKGYNHDYAFYLIE